MNVSNKIITCVSHANYFKHFQCDFRGIYLILDQTIQKPKITPFTIMLLGL